MSKRVLVAGVGNIFLGDDGFGVEVVKRLAGRELPEGVEVKDFGIRGMDLAYALQDNYELVVFVDATPRGEEPGTVYLRACVRSSIRLQSVDHQVDHRDQDDRLLARRSLLVILAQTPVSTQPP